MFLLCYFMSQKCFFCMTVNKQTLNHIIFRLLSCEYQIQFVSQIYLRFSFLAFFDECALRWFSCCDEKLSFISSFPIFFLLLSALREQFELCKYVGAGEYELCRNNSMFDLFISKINIVKQTGNIYGMKLLDFRQCKIFEIVRYCSFLN